ncbi:MAG TPA: hypothetical protein VN613_04725 [Gemmatimonadaceae bacterium]|nr:hypothetical protein [Gemmatimonadaceae bacterium]
MTDGFSTSDPRFHYTSIQPPTIDMARVNRMSDTIFSPDAAKLGWGEFARIGLLAGFALAYFIIWEKNANAQMILSQQKYEQDQANKNQATVDNDIAGERKRS